MYTQFACRECGHVWDSEGTPHSTCPKCGMEGAVIADDDGTYCPDCGFPEDECCCEKVCPCGCGGDIKQCAYASVCCICGNKFAGFGYNAKEYPCGDCYTTKPRVLVTGGAWSGHSWDYAGFENSPVGVLHRVQLDNGMATLVPYQQIKLAK